jgi:energy-coupling factor transporter transmembrane protein EcfT
MFVISVTCMTIDLLIAASTLAPGAPVVPQWPQFALFPLIFVIGFSGIIFNARRGVRTLFRGMPPAMTIGFVVLFFSVWLYLILTIPTTSGQPFTSGGRYFLNNHGSTIAVTKAAYDHALIQGQRIFTLGPSMFFALGAMLHYPRREIEGVPSSAQRKTSSDQSQP